MQTRAARVRATDKHFMRLWPTAVQRSQNTSMVQIETWQSNFTQGAVLDANSCARFGFVQGQQWR